jgi:hypothetical protein
MSAFLPARPKMYRPRLGAAQMLDTSTNLTIVGIVALICALWFIGTSPSSGDHRLQMLANTPNRGAELDASSLLATRRFDYVTVVGEARNVTQKTLNNVEAIVELYDAKGSLIAVDSGLIGVRQLGAGDSTPFSISLRDPGLASSFRVRFRSFLGRTLQSIQTSQ